jgi:hypothetical protein
MINWREFPARPEIGRVLVIIGEQSPCPPPLGAWGGRISFWPDPFYCGSNQILVHGCMPLGPYLPEFAVGYVVPLSGSALPDEVGHHIFMSCGLGLGEDEKGTYTSEFSAWLGGVRAAMRAEGL